MKLGLRIIQNILSYPGINFDLYGNRTPVVAVGNATAKKIFAIPEVDPASLWRVAVNLSTNWWALVIRSGLETTEATATKPANLTSWTLLPGIPDLTDGSRGIVSLPRSIRGPFELAGVVAEYCNVSRCAHNISQATLTFYTEIRKPSTFLEAAGYWKATYDVIPLCGKRDEAEGCTGLTYLPKVKACLEVSKACVVDVVATLTQTSAYDGLVYDANNSSTAAVAISKDVFTNLLPRFVPNVHWKLLEVYFVGWDHSMTSDSYECPQGKGLAYKKAIEAPLPTKTKPLLFQDWISDPFHFVEDSLNLTDFILPGFFRAVGSVDSPRIQMSPSLCTRNQAAAVNGDRWGPI